MKSAFALLLLALPAYASMGTYAGYWTHAANRKHAYISAVVDGNGINFPVPGTKHHGVCMVSANGVQTTVQGADQPPASYINVGCSETIDLPDPMPPGWEETVESQQQVICSFAGVVFLLQEGPSAIGYRLSSYTLSSAITYCVYNRSCIGTCALRAAFSHGFAAPCENIAPSAHRINSVCGTTFRHEGSTRRH